MTPTWRITQRKRQPEHAVDVPVASTCRRGRERIWPFDPRRNVAAAASSDAKCRDATLRVRPFVLLS